jgi:hypothetical protein
VTDGSKHPAFWSLTAARLLETLKVNAGGLTTGQAKTRLTSFGANRLKPQKSSNAFTLLIGHIRIHDRTRDQEQEAIFQEPAG